MAKKIGDKVLFYGKEVTITEVHKGKKTNKPVMQSGILCVGYKSAPCTYTLSTGQRVTGQTIVNSNK